MRLRVDETFYEIGDIQGSTLGNLMELKVKTKTADFTGVTVKSITDTFQRVGGLFQEPDFNPIDLLGDEDFLRTLVGLVFLTKRMAGEPVTVAEVWDTPFDDLEIIPEDEEVAEAEGSPKDSEVEGGSEPLSVTSASN